MTGLVFIWSTNTLQRTINAHVGPIFSMFSSENYIVTGAKEKYVEIINYFVQINEFYFLRRSFGSVRVLNPVKVWDLEMTNGKPVKLDLPPADTVCVRSVCRNPQVQK
jgi:hypothetical protein